MAFDPAVVEVVDAIPGSGIQLEVGDFLNPPLWFAFNEADNTAGTIKYAASQLNPTEPVSGSGILAVIYLRAKSEGTAALEFKYTKLAERNGTQIPAVSYDGTASTTPPPAPILSISKLTTTTARLSWTGVSGIAEYHLYRDTAPYFTPAGTPHHTTTSLSYDDAGVLGNPATSYYYVMRSSCANDFKSAYSNRVGEFDFTLTGPGYSAVALPLIVPAITDADSLAAYTCASCVDQVWRWIASAQDWQYRLPQVPFGTNFPTQTGGAYFLGLNASAPAVLTLAGGVPAQESITFPLVAGSGGVCSTNFVSIPLDKEEITNADELAADMGNTVDQVWRWDEPGQTWQYRLPKVGFGTIFGTRIGYPYSVCVDQYAPSVWPSY